MMTTIDPAPSVFVVLKGSSCTARLLPSQLLNAYRVLSLSIVDVRYISGPQNCCPEWYLTSVACHFWTMHHRGMWPYEEVIHSVSYAWRQHQAGPRSQSWDKKGTHLQDVQRHVNIDREDLRYLGHQLPSIELECYLRHLMNTLLEQKRSKIPHASSTQPFQVRLVHQV